MILTNPVIFYNILLFSLLCFFIPSVYNFMFNYSIGRVIIIILIAYFTKINFYVGLVFITIIIIMSSSLYEGFATGQSAIVTRNYSVDKNDKKNPQKVFSYFRDFYCSPSNKNTPDANKMSKWNNLANTSKDQNVVAIAKYNIDRANAICSVASIPVPDNDLEWNVSNAKIPNKCMGGWTHIGGLCYGPPGERCSPYSWYGMSGYTPGGLNTWTSYCGVNNTNVAIANAEKVRNAENSCRSGDTSTLFSINKPSCLLNNMESICSSIKNIDPQISNVLNPSITVGLDKSFEQDAQWLKNTYRDFCVKPQTGIGPLLR
jgi:hypothetical protein